jgi:chaperonin GroES
MKKKSKAKKASKPVAKKAAPASSIASKVGIAPLADRIVVKPLTREEMEGTTTSFGIIIPDTSKEKPEQGWVVAVGPGKRGDDGELIPVSVRVGDKVMFSKYGYDEVKIDGIEYYIVSEQNVLAVIGK